MRPELFHISGAPVHSYTVMMALALFMTVYLGARECEKRGVPLTPVAGLIVFAAGYLGARVFHVVQFEGWSRILHAFKFWQSGLVFHGGLTAGVIAFLVYLLIKRISLLDALDIAAPYAALGEAIGRVGCLLNGCCWGSATSVPWAVTYRPGTYPFESQVNLGDIALSAHQSLPVHPTQIYMAAALLLIFVVLKRSLNWKAFAGVSILLYAMLQGVLRLLVESYRGDVTVAYWGLTSGQLVSVGLILLAFVALPIAYLKRRERWSADL
ncbi:MAG: prolipoprotein diacylglyceryl transferase [Candidatus Hydrogenedentales bacterium]|jgi:phosphatidylglycerol:prolipoprotein diacylglycerol transferase